MDDTFTNSLLCMGIFGLMIWVMLLNNDIESLEKDIESLRQHIFGGE